MPQAIFFKITSSFLKLAQFSTHGGEKHGTHVHTIVSMTITNKKALGTFLRITSSLLKLINGNMYGGET